MSTPAQPPPFGAAEIAAGGGGTAEGFGQALRELFAAAGSPTLTATATAANANGGDRVSVQKLSNWCSGRHLPDRFDTIAPVLVWLILRAREQAFTAPPAGTREVSVRSMRDWYRLFATAKDSTTTSGDYSGGIEATELLLTHPDPGVAQEVVEEQIAAAIVQLTGIDPATGEPVATDVPSSALPADAADLLAATGLIASTPATTASARPWGLVRWTEAAIPLQWERAAPLIERHHLALAARTGLLADAARWSAAPDPHALYTWQQLTTCGRHLQTLPTKFVAAVPVSAAAIESPAQAYRFGDGVTAQNIPSPALPFWEASQNAAERQLTVHRLIMATVIAVIALAVITAAIAGALTS